MEVFVSADTGTDYQNHWIINPILILLAMGLENNVKTIAHLFGFKALNLDKGGGNDRTVKRENNWIC